MTSKNNDFMSLYGKTSREQPKSAPYLRLKSSKRTSKCHIFSSTVPEWGEKFSNFFENFFEVSGRSHSANKCKREGPLGFFERPFCSKREKYEQERHKSVPRIRLKKYKSSECAKRQLL